jgi:hypothetical protein
VDARSTANVQVIMQVGIPPRQHQLTCKEQRAPANNCFKTLLRLLHARWERRRDGTADWLVYFLQAQKEIPADFANCKDKFLVQVKGLEAGEVRQQLLWLWTSKRCRCLQDRADITACDTVKAPACNPQPLLGHAVLLCDVFVADTYAAGLLLRVCLQDVTADTFKAGKGVKVCSRQSSRGSSISS